MKKSAFALLAFGLILFFLLNGCNEPLIPTEEYEVHEWGVIAGCHSSEQWILTSRPEQATAVLVKEPVIYVHAGNLKNFSAKAIFSSGNPTLAYPQAEISKNSLKWENVQVVGKTGKTEMETVKGFGELLPLQSIIPTLNDVEADLLKHGDTEARFLFYEGEMQFENKITVSYELEEAGDSSKIKGQKAIVKNNAGYDVFNVFLSINTGPVYGVKYAYTGFLSELKAGQSKEIKLDYRKLDGDELVELRNREKLGLKAKMMQLGFTEKESQAFDSLWATPFYRPSNIDRFARLSYLLPQSETEKLIKLEFNPTPKKTIRAMWVLVDLSEEKKCETDFDCEKWGHETCSYGCYFSCKNGACACSCEELACKNDNDCKKLVKISQCPISCQKGFCLENCGRAGECQQDEDCTWVNTNCCPESAGAKWECMSKLAKIDCPENPVCLQVISPKPETMCLCRGGKNSCEEVRVTIKTDKTEYEQGETVKLNAEIKGNLYDWRGITIEKKVGGEWLSAERDYGYPCFLKKTCEEFLNLPQMVRPLCKKIENSFLREWTQEASTGVVPPCEWSGEPKGVPYCRIIHKAEAGIYRFSLSYWLDENCAGEEFEVKSNEFKIKAPKEIVELCSKEKARAEEIKADPDCSEDGFRCVDGWGQYYYYDNWLANPKDSMKSLNYDPPARVKNALIAKYLRSNCSCNKPFSYQIVTNNGFKETECESYYSFLRDYNALCNGCVLHWETGCC
ncbi:MAG: hypothetical protein QXK06_00760 [Candidatus Diapherotrites archaeon]